MAGAKPLYGLHELAYRTQYAELKERASAAGNLPGDALQAYRLSRIQALLEAHPQTQDAFSAAMTRC